MNPTEENICAVILIKDLLNHFIVYVHLVNLLSDHPSHFSALHHYVLCIIVKLRKEKYHNFIPQLYKAT
jgi:hypothetical protein